SLWLSSHRALSKLDYSAAIALGGGADRLVLFAHSGFRSAGLSVGLFYCVIIYVWGGGDTGYCHRCTGSQYSEKGTAALGQYLTGDWGKIGFHGRWWCDFAVFSFFAVAKH